MAALWDRLDCLAMARQGCRTCFGSGMAGRLWTDPCHCVLRAVFRACLREAARRSARRNGSFARVSLDPDATRSRRTIYALRDQDFVADFSLAARRALGPESKEYLIFKLHFLQGKDWKECSAASGLDRGEHFHAIYRIEARLGRAFAELRPYRLWPVDEYFSRVEGERRTPAELLKRRVPAALPYPLRLAA